jgi:hypothetical protein
MENIECSPIINFDDLVTFENIEPLDFEIELYKPFAIPQISAYDPIFVDKQYRPGCEYESTLR